MTRTRAMAGIALVATTLFAAALAAQPKGGAKDSTAALCEAGIPAPPPKVEPGEQRVLSILDMCQPRLNDLYLAARWRVVHLAGVKDSGAIVVVEKLKGGAGRSVTKAGDRTDLDPSFR